MTEAEANREFDKLCEAKGVKRQDIEALFDLVASDEDEDVVLEKIGRYPEAARALLYECIVPPRSTTDRSKGGFFLYLAAGATSPVNWHSPFTVNRDSRFPHYTEIKDQR